jgi:hypothetical protein
MRDRLIERKTESIYDDLLSNYNKSGRPMVNVSEAVTVTLKLKLSQLIDVVRSFITGVPNLFLIAYH